MNITMIIVVLSGLAALNIMLLIMMGPKVLTVLRNIQKFKIDVNNPYLPDYVIHKDQPIRFPVGDKCLYLKPMTVALYTVYVDRMYTFYKEFGEYLKAFDIDKSMKDVTQDDISSLMGLFKLPKARVTFLQIVKDTILLDPTINKDKIKYRYMMKMDISELIQLFIVLYDRNITCVRSFIASLLTRLGEGVEKQKAGLGLWSLQDTQWMLSQISQSQKQNLSQPDGQNKTPDSPTNSIKRINKSNQLIEV